jgi:hypothetical protein
MATQPGMETSVTIYAPNRVLATTGPRSGTPDPTFIFKIHSPTRVRTYLLRSMRASGSVGNEIENRLKFLLLPVSRNHKMGFMIGYNRALFYRHNARLTLVRTSGIFVWEAIHVMASVSHFRRSSRIRNSLRILRSQMPNVDDHFGSNP